ncbi:hypothetical protein ACWD5V_27220 [Streptomyces sp. NPDC002523]
MTEMFPSRSRGARGPGRSAPGPERPVLLRFDGWIAGLGTASGTRLVLGHWAHSPFGAYSDVLLEHAEGHRLLLAPTHRTADFVARTYTFDEVRVLPVRVGIAGNRWTVVAGSLLDLTFTVGRRGALGVLLGAVPGPVSARPSYATLTGPAARLLLGVRTHGTARAGRHEWYGAHDLHPVTSAAAGFDGRDLGALAPVDPPVHVGFGSTPRAPCLVRITTTVRAPDPSEGLRYR